MSLIHFEDFHIMSHFNINRLYVLEQTESPSQPFIVRELTSLHSPRAQTYFKYFFLIWLNFWCIKFNPRQRQGFVPCFDNPSKHWMENAWKSSVPQLLVAGPAIQQQKNPSACPLEETEKFLEPTKESSQCEQQSKFRSLHPRAHRFASPNFTTAVWPRSFLLWKLCKCYFISIRYLLSMLGFLAYTTICCL